MTLTAPSYLQRWFSRHTAVFSFIVLVLVAGGIALLIYGIRTNYESLPVVTLVALVITLVLRA